MALHRPRPHRSLRQRGAVLPIMTLAMLAMLAMAMLALDGGHMLVNKSRLQNAVDAAALSGAKTLLQVRGSLNAATVTQTAARNTLLLNANATGNAELSAAIAGNVAGFAIVELSSSVYGPFSFPGPTDARYVRVSVPNYPLTGFLWGILSALGNGAGPNKGVAAIATAGPSPTSPCDLAPLLICGDTSAGQHDPANGLFWGFRLGAVETLKTAKNDTSGLGPGQFQLLDFGSGGSAVREELAGGGLLCPNVGGTVPTKSGNTVGPSVQGLNTRFGDYSGGGMDAATYPPDLVTTYNQLDNGKPALEPDLDTDTVTYLGTGGGVVSADAQGNLSTPSTPLLDYNDWHASSAACVANPGSSGCQSGGVFERRMLKVVIGQCSGNDTDKAAVPVIGFGCFFVLQPMDQKGGEAWILGQFVTTCEGDNLPNPTLPFDSGPQIIQLYKTYIDNARTPSNDS